MLLTAVSGLPENCDRAIETLLSKNFRYAARSNGATAFADSEALGLFHCNRGDKLNFDRDFVTRHNHLDTFRKLDDTGNVRCSEVELRSVVGEERAVTSAFIFGQNVDFSSELRVRGNGTRLCENLSALNFFFLRAAKKASDIVAGLTFVKLFAEHFNTGDRGLGRRLDADDLNRIANLDFTALDSSGNNRSTSFNGEDVFEGLSTSRSGSGTHASIASMSS